MLKNIIFYNFLEVFIMERINNYFPENVSIPVNAKISVKNLSSPRTGEPVKNQFCINIPLAGTTQFQSYNTTCLVYDRECYVLTVYPEAFGYSVTTSKYSRAFLRDEIGLDDSDIDQIRKLAKTESFGRDCPLYIQL